MREIKFRAWDSVDKKFIDKFHIVNTGGVKVFIASFDMGGRGTWSYLSEERCKLIQYTGIKDKNGKEIYEGDIVKPNSSHVDKQGNYTVEWDFTSFLMKHKGSFYFMSKSAWDNCEIIGNIYETIKEGKE